MIGKIITVLNSTRTILYRFIAKGAIHARIQIGNDKFIDVFNTSLQDSFAPKLSEVDPIYLKRQKQIFQLREFIASCLDSKQENAVILAGDFKVNARDQGSAAHSLEYRDLVSIVKGGKVDIDPIKESFSLALDDVLFQRFKQHPVTFGDSGDAKMLSYGVEGKSRLVETFLTEKYYTGSNQSTVHLFLANPAKPVLKLSEVTLNPFLVDSQEFTHLSDHYGLFATFSSN